MTTLEGRERASYVKDMFGRIAHRYDLMNRLMTFGQDRTWRRAAVKLAELPENGRFLDVATGTGDIAFDALIKHPDLDLISGADFSAPMMQVGMRRRNGEQVTWAEADALALPYPNRLFDAVASGYLMRNVIDVAGAFREQMRVTKAGGKVVCLDTSPPPPNLLRPFILLYFRYVIPTLGRIVTGDGSAYGYLPESTKGFKTPDELAEVMQEVGLLDVSYRTFMFGTMAVHVGTCPTEEK